MSRARISACVVWLAVVTAVVASIPLLAPTPDFPAVNRTSEVVTHNYTESDRAKFLELRAAAETITETDDLKRVRELLGEPDSVRPWPIEGFTQWQVYHFDIDRLGKCDRTPPVIISVLVDGSGKVLCVDVYDAVFGTCSGLNKVPHCKTNVHDRLVGPEITCCS